MRVLRGFDDSYSLFSGALPRQASDVDMESWVVENVSLGGFRAHVDDGTGEQQIKIGSLLCVQAEGGENWMLGVARRFNRRGPADASPGVQVLSRRAVSIELRPRRSGFSAVALPGIWLQDSGESGVLRMVLPLAGFNVRESLEFTHQGRRWLLTPLELEEAGVEYEIGRFREQATA